MTTLERIKELEEKKTSINRSIGQLKRHNTIWNEFKNAEKIRDKQFELIAVDYQIVELAWTL